MFCSNCGKELVPEAKFCPNCGTPVSDVNINISDETDIQNNISILPVLDEDNQFNNTLDMDKQVSDDSSDDNIMTEEVAEDKIDQVSVEVQNEIPVLPDNSEILSELENTIPGIVSYGNTVQDNGKTQIEKEGETGLDIDNISTETSFSENDVEQHPVQIPPAFRVNTDQPVYVTQQTNVMPPAYAQPTAIPVSAQKGQNPPAVKKSKKSKTPLIIVAVLVLAAIIGYFIYQNSPSVKFDKAMTAGETSYQNGDYNTALEQFQKAYEIKPDDEVAQSDIFSCYDLMAEQAYDNDDYASCIAFYNEAKYYCPNKIETCDEYIKAVYSDWCLNTASAGDIDTAEKIYGEALGAGYDMTTTRENLDVIIATAKLMNEGSEAAQYLAESIDNDSLSFIMLAFSTKAKSFVDAYLDAGGDTPVIFDVEGCVFDKLGFYDLGDGSYSFYYGEYSGDIRDGYGKWFIYSPQGFGSLTEYSMEGDFSGDIPNGSAKEHYLITRSDSDNLEIYIDSTVINALYDGTVTWEYVNDDVYTGSFHNGLVDVIDTVDPNGNESYVIAYNADKSAWIFRQEDRLDRIDGIQGF